MIYWPRRCRECGVMYTLMDREDLRWKDLCTVHRQPVKDRDLRKDVVMAWASQNWERLEAIRASEIEAELHERNKIQQQAFNRMANEMSRRGNDALLNIGGCGNLGAAGLP